MILFRLPESVRRTLHLPPRNAPGSGSVAPVLLLIGFAMFLFIVVLLLLPSIIHPQVPVFVPRIVGLAIPPGAGLTIDTVTVDAGAEHRWQYFDFERGVVSVPPDTAGWDLRLQRFHFVPSGEIASLGKALFDTVRVAPEAGYVATTYGRDTVNAVTARWYSYSYTSHLLMPKGDLYVLRTREGHYVKLQIIGYYCAGPTPGCLTFRYAYQPDGGTTVGR